MSEAVAFHENYEDLGALALLIERANAQRDEEIVPTELRTPLPIIRLREKITQPGAWLHVATIGEVPAGLAQGYPTDEKTEYVSLLMVEPDFWGRRIASSLLNIVAERAAQSGREQITLWTAAHNNDRAQQFYEHKGYQATGQFQLSRFGRQMQYAKTF